MKVRGWEELDLAAQKEEFEKQALASEWRECVKQWLKNYCFLARALADAFGEEEVLDILERVWWDLQYEGGKTWREEFEKDPRAALVAMAHRWHDRPYQGLSLGVFDVSVLEESRWELLCYHCYHKVFIEMDERKIGISWCMSDLAAVQGWSPKIVMHFPSVLLRGDSFCHQIREVREDADPDLAHWSREKSESFGWRSIKRLEDNCDAH